MNLVELVIEVDRCLGRAGVAHAFGGALALAYVAEPRGTVDIDVNVFAPVDDLDTVLDTFAVLDLRAENPRGEWLPMAGIRLRRGADRYPVYVFLSLDDRYAEIERRCVRHPFGPNGVRLPFLSPEDLVIFKLSFGRDKDWVDLRAIARARPGLDLDYVERQLIGLRGPGMYPRLVRLGNLVRSAARGS